jgi:hypothetical protein
VDTQLIIAILGFITAIVGLAAAYLGRRKEIVHRHVNDAPTTASGHSSPVPSAPAAHAEAQRLRTRLLAEPYDVPTRRAYLSARTNDLLELDREAGREQAGALVPIMLFAGLILGGLVGVMLGVETQEARLLGISVGREFKSLNPVPAVLCGLVGMGLVYGMVRPVVQNRLATLWGEVGPVPDELVKQKTDYIKKKLFGHKTGWFQ